MEPPACIPTGVGSLLVAVSVCRSVSDYVKCSAAQGADIAQHALGVQALAVDELQAGARARAAPRETTTNPCVTPGSNEQTTSCSSVSSKGQARLHRRIHGIVGSESLPPPLTSDSPGRAQPTRFAPHSSRLSRLRKALRKSLFE